MSATTVSTLLKRNEATSAAHIPIPTFAELKAADGLHLKTLVVTCMDPRCVPEKYFDFGVGEIIVVRTAGGNVRYSFRDIAILDELFTLDEIAIVHHTDCGSLLFTDEQIRKGIKARTDKAHWPDVDAMAFGENTDIVESVRGDLKWVKENPLIREELKKGTQGFVLDIKSGKVNRVN